jgi:hypothetical protein
MCSCGAEPWDSLGPNLVSACVRGGLFRAALLIYSGLDARSRLRLDDRTLAAINQPDFLVAERDEYMPKSVPSTEPAGLLKL